MLLLLLLFAVSFNQTVNQINCIRYSPELNMLGRQLLARGAVAREGGIVGVPAMVPRTHT